MSDVAGWTVEPHQIPVELTHEYVAEPYTPPAATFFPPIAGRLSETMQTRLRDLYGAV